MIHEVLLALSGHPSPLFDNGDSADATQLPLLSGPERALLQTLGSLSQLHRKLKAHVEHIASSHPSIICRAVAVSIRHDHLSRFQKKILDVESRILQKDASMVGAYDIVPLASIVSEFDEWQRRMTWYWDVSCFILPPQDRSNSRISLNCSGSKIIDRLRLEAQTGHPNIEEAAIELSRVAETAWLRQLSAWMVYGKLPNIASQDFFIQAEDVQPPSFRRQKLLQPSFVSAHTANSILFVGRSIHQVEHHRRSSPAVTVPAAAADEAQLAAAHLEQLASLSLPLLPWQFSKTVAEIRLSLSRNVLQHLLPRSLTATAMACLRQFFLLDRGEFSISLITEAEHRLQTRQQSIGRLLQQDPVKAFRGLTIKDAELSQTLGQTWKTLVVQSEGDDDEVLDFAQEHVKLSIPTANDSRPSTADSAGASMPEISTVSFNNLLFPTPTKLTLNVAPSLSLFLSRQELDTYSSINAYLLAIRRGHLKLSDLWRRSAARRDHPLVLYPQSQLRERLSQRAVAMRKVWATCSAAVFLLAETAAFFEGEIIRGSSEHFQAWIDQPPSTADEQNKTTAGTQRRATVSSISSSKSSSNRNSRTVEPKRNGDSRDINYGTTTDTTAPIMPSATRDPETLAAGHRAFLAALTYALLLTDTPHTRALRSLLGNVDQLVAFFGRLLDVQQRLDADREAGTENPHVVEDEQRMALELDRARKKVDGDLRAVVQRLRQLDQERVGAARYLELSSVAVATGDDGGSGYQPWKAGGVDRLLMKLEFGRMVVSDASADLL